MSVLHLDDLDAIRRPTPKLDRAWAIGLGLLALGGFASGVIQQAFGPLGVQPAPVESAAPVAVAATQPAAQAPPPSVKPTMQVAAAPPQAAEPVKLEVPEPLPAAPEPAAPTVAPTVEAVAAPSAEAPAVEPVAPAPAEPADSAEPPVA
jgi:hypothetical protein